MKEVLITTILSIFAVSGMAQSGKVHCHIEGQLVRKPNCDKVVLLHDGQIPRFVKGKTIEVKNGKFSYDLYADEPDVYTFIPYDEYLNGQFSSATIFAENGNVNITFIGDSEESPIVHASTPLHNERQRIIKDADSLYTDRIWAEIEQLEKEGRDYTPEFTSITTQMEVEQNDARRDSLQKEYTRLYDKGKAYTPEYNALEKQAEEGTRKIYRHYISYAKQQPSLVGLHLLHRTRGSSYVGDELADSLMHVFHTVYESRYPNHRMTEDLLRWIVARNIKVGGRYHDFTAPDLSDVKHTLSEEIKGKVALIDLWASWCGPCRETSKSMIPIYEAYKDKGFTIVGVARETDANNMARAVERDKYPWLNLVELNDSAHIWEHYGIKNAAGGTYLVDRNGIILAINPTADEVRALLEKVMK